MIMPRGHLLLMPASNRFVWGSLLGALALNMAWGRATGTQGLWAPDWMLLTLTFWNIYQPLKVGVVSAFVFGVLMDVQSASLLGQHALAYTLSAYTAVSLQRRILWFDAWRQALQLFSLFLGVHFVQWMARWLSGDALLFGSEWLSPASTALFWPLGRALLLAPQRRAPDPDDIRPL